jgi:hypothetical protein
LTLIAWPGVNSISKKIILADSRSVLLEITTISGQSETIYHIDASEIDLQLMIVADEPKVVLVDGVLLQKRVDLTGTPASSGWTWDEKLKVITIVLAARSTQSIIKIQ